MLAAKKLNSYLFDEVDPLPICIMRMVTGLIYFSYYATHFNDFIPIFSWNGLAGLHTNINLHFDFIYWILYFTLLISSLTLTVGFWTKTSLVLSTGLHLFFLVTCFSAYWGCGSAMLYSSYFLLFCNPGSMVSFDRKLNKKVPSLSGIARWKILLIQLFVCSIYTTVCLYRVGSLNWADGTAIYHGAANVILGRFPLLPWQDFMSLIVILTYGTILIETSAAALIFLGKYQKYVLMILLPFHLISEVLLTVGYWQFFMPALESSFFPKTWNDKIYCFFKIQKPVLKKTKPTSLQKWGAAVAFMILLMSFTNGIPRKLTPTWFWDFQMLEYKILNPMYLSHFWHFNLVDRPHATLLNCMVVLGYSGQNTTLVYTTPKDDCLGKDRTPVSYFRNALFVYEKYTQMWLTKEKQEWGQRHLGNYFCTDPFSDKKRKIDVVQMGHFNDMISLKEKSSLSPFFKTLFAFDCQKGELVPIQKGQLLKNLKENHPDYFEDFKSKGF